MAESLFPAPKEHFMTNPLRRAATALAAAAVLVFAAACGSSTPAAAPTSTGSSAPSISGDINVFAAASLTESFNTIGKQFESAHPGTHVIFNYAGSSALATQITQGAVADVFASASPATMKTVTDGGDNAGTPTNFVKNQLVIAVPKGNPKNITSLADLTKPGIKVALCAADVPCGAAATKALAAANVKLTPVTLEEDVKQALSKVTLGEVDAALVYRTDAKAASDKVDGIEFPESAQAINTYPIVLLKGGKNPTGGQAFIDYVLSDPGKSVLTAAGFQAP
jgi:molybdate transport system substrate-binding protein